MKKYNPGPIYFKGKFSSVGQLVSTTPVYAV
mgnify:CR=1 FL=1